VPGSLEFSKCLVAIGRHRDPAHALITQHLGNQRRRELVVVDEQNAFGLGRQDWITRLISM
jgi:hypothetical protein